MMACFLGSPCIVEYRTSPQQKAKSRQAALEKKFGSPKIELLRKKCRDRAKAARENKYTSGRKLLDDTTFIQHIVLEELNELDLKLEDIILKDIFDEANFWFAEALEAEEENYLMSNYNSADLVFCPICQKLNLEASPVEKNVFFCNCGIRFNFSGSMSDFQHKMQQLLDAHEKSCDANLSFFIEPYSDASLALNAFCDKCEIFQLLR